jgi:hypothetical protein
MASLSPAGDRITDTISRKCERRHLVCWVATGPIGRKTQPFDTASDRVPKAAIMNNPDMHVRGVNSTRTRSFARYGAVVAAVAAALSAAGPAAARDRDVIDVKPSLTVVAEPTEMPPTEPTQPVPPAPPGPLVVARYAFDQAGRTVADLSGHGHTLRIRAGHGGRTRMVRHQPGRALAFPKKCTDSTCARVVLQAPHSPELNPGTSPFAFGATVKLSRKQTSKGQNVVQKGYSARGSQYKLQIDGAAGKPSCVLVGENRPRIRLVKSSVTVADNTWHRIECRRVGIAWSIVVDGVPRGLIAVPANLSVANTSPLSLGGKGGYQDNDQFQGAFDDVWLSVG